uniref:Uncharacterized protein n=1 Tax=viral metagenome TaxID=1070528 RepID=A0A2V0RB32_9ZZZZ
MQQSGTPVSTELDVFTTQLNDALQSLVFDGLPGSDAYSVLGEIVSEFWDRAPTQVILRELYRLMLDGDLLSGMTQLGTRSAVENILCNGNVRMLPGTDVPLGAEASNVLVRLRTMFDAAMSIREDAYLREISTYDNEAMFTYRTSDGALFPSPPSYVEGEEMLAMLHGATNGADEITVASPFTSSIEKLRAIPAAEQTDFKYEVLAKKEADFILKGTELKFNVSVHSQNTIGHGKHILERIATYEIDAGIENVFGMLSGSQCTGIISDGRNVLRAADEHIKDVNDKYLLTCALNLQLPCRMVKDLEQTMLDVKVIASGYVTPTIGKKKCTFPEYLDNDTRDPLNLKVTFVVTIIPTATSMPMSTLMTTGFPVIPSFVEDVHIEPSIQDIGSDTMLPRGVIANMNESLRETDQWSNLKHELFKTKDGKFLTNRSEFPNIVQITKFGVEFEDVENLKVNHVPQYKLLSMIGLKYLSKASGVPLNIVEGWWSKVKLGPSITHSGVIRTHASPFSGTKPFNRNDLLVRYALSRMFSVGLGKVTDVGGIDSTQGVRLPQSIHLLNPKRAEALMLPLSVTKVGIIVYSLSGGLAKLLEHVNLGGKEMRDSYLNTFYQKNVPRRNSTRSRTPTSRVEDVDERPLFVTKAVPIIVNDKTTPRNDRFSLVFPSGMEVSVSAIVSDIASQMRNHKTISMRNENAVVWHPNFAIIVSQTVKILGSLPAKRTYHAVVLPAVRKSRIAPPFRNVGSAIRDSVTSPGQLVHYARLGESFGYIGGLNRALESLKRQRSGQ